MNVVKNNTYLTRISTFCCFLLVITGVITGVVLIAPASSFAADTVYYYSWQKGDTGPNVPGGIVNSTGIFEDVSFSFNATGEELHLDFTLSDPTLSDPGSPLLVAKFFTIVLTNGFLPLEQCGNEAAVLYVDATGTTPVVTVYTYVPDLGDLQWETGSWMTGDQICSSLNTGCGDWVTSNTVTDNANGSRTFHLNILTSAINNFSPSTQSSDPLCVPYSGVQFDEGIGFWLETFSYPNLLSQYDQSGFISNLDHGCWFYGTQQECESGSNTYQGQFDEKHLLSFQKPVCEDPSGTVTLLPGTPLSQIVKGTSPDGDPLTVTYSGVPNGATVTPADGTTDPDGMIDATLNWTPDAQDENTSRTVTFTFTEKDGTAVCNLDIAVDSLGCEETDILGAQFSMDGNALLQLKSVRKLTQKLVRTSNGSTASKKFRKVTNKAAKALYQTAWGSTWTFDSTIQACTNQVFCVSVSNVSTLDDYVQSVDSLFILAKKAKRKIKKAGGRAGKLVKAAKKAKDAALISVAQIPSTQSECSM